MNRNLHRSLPISCAAVVLAGGASKRFGGRPKALAEIRGRPMIAWVLDALEPVATEIAIEIGSHRRKDYERFGRPLLASVTGLGGPLIGLIAALEWADGRADWLAIAPCDTPMIESGVYRALAARIVDEKCMGVFARTSDGPHPLIALLNVGILARIRHLTEIERTLSVQCIHALCGVAAVQFKPSASFFNVNTPDDVLRCVQKMRDRNDSTPNSG